ncbi:MAG: hypothetical protein ABI180_19725 [Microcoleus sp.]
MLCPYLYVYGALPVFVEALYNYAAAKHQEAAELFADCVRNNPLDQVAQNYLQRCQEMQVILPQSRSDFI